MRTLKHFPFTLKDYDLEKTTIDFKLSKRELLNLIEIFNKLATNSEFIIVPVL